MIPRTLQLVAAIALVLSTCFGGDSSGDLEIRAMFDDAKHDLVVSTTARQCDMLVTQINIPRKWAIDAAVACAAGFIQRDIQHEASESADVHALIERANREVMVFEGEFLVKAGTTAEIRFPAKTRPSENCRVMVSFHQHAARAAGSGAKFIDVE